MSGEETWRAMNQGGGYERVRLYDVCGLYAHEYMGAVFDTGYDAVMAWAVKNHRTVVEIVPPDGQSADERVEAMLKRCISACEVAAKPWEIGEGATHVRVGARACREALYAFEEAENLRYDRE